MDSKAWLARAMALALMVPVAACSREEETEANIEVESEQPATPAAAPMTIQINPQGGAMVGGELTATHEAERTNVRVTLNGLTEGQDYEAKLRYGDCTVAANFLEDADEAMGTTTPGTGVANHEIGDEVADIDLQITGTTATGTADIDNDELAMNEPAYVVVTQEDRLVACGDLRASGAHGDTGTMGAPATPGMTPGATMPADSAR